MDTLLKLKKVNLKYQTDKDAIKVLNNIDLTTKKKDTISIMGESGSGKTSLIMLIGGLEKVTSGKIFFKDQDITALSEDEVSEIRRKHIGIVFQSFYLIPNYTAVENVALTLELNKRKNILLLDFNPERYEYLLLELSKLNHNIILLNQRKPAVWNKNSLKIIRKTNTSVINLNNFSNFLFG